MPHTPGVTSALLVLAVLLLAYANGANDTFKGVATLYGSGTTTFRRAVAYATVAAVLGALVALVAGEGLVKVFGGRGLVPDAVAASVDFATSVAFGAAATVLLATVLGLPVSTTHALTGALVGAGLVTAGADGVSPSTLGAAFLLPLLASPVLSLGLAATLFGASRAAGRRLGVTGESCACAGPVEAVAPALASDAVASASFVEAPALPTVTLGDTTTTCAPALATGGAAVTVNGAIAAAHYVSAGAVCFARALNDTPKLVGILAVSGVLEVRPALLLAGAAVAVGGLVQSRKVAETMSKKITPMTEGAGFAGNLVTAALVLAASGWSLPVSTTHVSCGALFGIGVATGQARLSVIAQILLAWVTTLPLGAACAALVALALC